MYGRTTAVVVINTCTFLTDGSSARWETRSQERRPHPVHGGDGDALRGARLPEDGPICSPGDPVVSNEVEARLDVARLVGRVLMAEACTHTDGIAVFLLRHCIHRHSLVGCRVEHWKGHTHTHYERSR